MASMPRGIFEPQHVSNENPLSSACQAKTDIPIYSCLCSFVDTV